MDSRLNKWRREIEELSESAIRETNNKVAEEYRKLLRQLKKDVQEAINNPDNLTNMGTVRLERRVDMAKQISEDVGLHYPNIRGRIKEGVTENANLGYYGNWYELEQNNRIDINMNLLDKRRLEQIVTKPVAGKRFSQRLYSNRNKLARGVNAALIDGITQGLMYDEIADKIEEFVEGDYKRALKIARTESMRVNSEARQEANEAAAETGVIFQKQWLSTLDNRTRDTHQELDGQIREVDEEFESPAGHKALEPRMFGVAEEDIQCRCTTINIVDGIEPDTRMARDLNNENQTIPNVNYKEWHEYRTKRLETGIIGIETTDRVIISDMAEHVFDRAAQRGLSFDQMKESLINPIHIQEVKYDTQGRPSKKYLGKEVTIAINPETGKIVTVHKTRKDQRKKYGGGS